MTGRVTVPQPNAQFQSRGWSDLTALTYVASYPDLANTFGVNAEAGRAHYTNHGHGENRGVIFNVDAYLASRPDVRNAAVAALSQPGVTVVPGDGESLAYVDVPTADGGRALLYARGTDDNSGEAIWGGSDGNDGWIGMTQSQINALAAPVPPAEDAIRLFAVQHYITNGRFEMAQAA